MIPWIQVYTNLPSHRKTCRLRDALALKSNYEAVGLLICFWSWAAVNAVGGNLSGYSARDISDASGYKKSPDKFLNALIESGFVDKTENGFSIHDWEEHAALLMDSNEQQKKNTRERVRRYRERRKGNVEPSGNGECNATGNASNAPTLPNLTLPNLTNNFSSSSSRADAACDQIDIIADDLFSRYVNRKQTKSDWENIYDRVCFGGKVQEDAVGLLDYAFESAAKAGLGGNWNYINAVLERCYLHNIYTVEQARAADEERGNDV